MLVVPVPTADGVYETLHVAALVPLLDSVHIGGVNVPEPSVEKVTVPVGFVAPEVLVSVTVAVHEVLVPTVTGPGVHTTAVVVKCSVGCVMVTVAPWIVSGNVVPTLSATRTHTLAGEKTLLVAHPRPSVG